MLTSLILPVILSAVALFFASFLSWMVLHLHSKDWRKIDREDELMNTVRAIDLAAGSYTFPACNSPEEMKSQEFQKKYATGPKGVITVFPKVNMGRNLALTFFYFLIVSFLLAYLGTIGLEAGEEFKEVFRFISTAAFMTFLAAIVQHAIWFQNRIIGHVVESIFYAAIVGAIFAAMWPGSST